jgi:isopenicillin-N N-acyltransferase like protein
VSASQESASSEPELASSEPTSKADDKLDAETKIESAPEAQDDQPNVASKAPTKKPSFARRHKKKLIALAVLLVLPVLMHIGVALLTRLTPPALPDLSSIKAERSDDGITRAGPSYKRKRGKVLEVRLRGTPAEIGHAHSTLLYDEMVESEGALYKTFEKYVPLSPVRHLIVDIGKFQFRHVDRGIASDRLLEIAAEARAFSPDPFESYIPTYQRLVYLQSLYDISLSFEHSPLLGCTSFVATGKATANGHTYLARNFDFEAGPVYDDGKVVFLVEEEGKIPYASVAWPGFVGTVSGMNAKGVAVVIHGGRARDTREDGEPVVHTTRAILAEASNLDEAIAIVQSRKAMVSHMLLISDAEGHAAVIERAPGEAPFVRRMDSDELPLTNHFEGPFAADPKNQSIRAHTSTLPRRARLDELLEGSGPLTPEAIVDILRDKKGKGGDDLPLGNRGAIDAVIATHGVVMDSTDRVLWVSEGPHLMGRFVRFDLQKLLDPNFEPSASDPVDAISEDPALDDGRYKAWVDGGSKHPGIQK